MRRLALFSVCLLALVPAFAEAHAAVGKGTVQRSWISRTSGGQAEASFSVAAVKRLYANFVWKVPATPGQKLRIEWRDPSNTLRAVWTDKTKTKDVKGTRLYAWITTAVVKGKLGTWNAVLTVGDTPIGKHKFRVVA
jgi:hypothetical protein